MRKILFLLILFGGYTLNAQEIENTQAANPQKAKKNTSSAKKQGEVLDKWLKSKGRNNAEKSKLRKEADKKYDKLGYMAAMDKYRMLDANEQSDLAAMTKMANSYRLNNHTDEAEYWYAHVVNYTKNPEVVLQYAQVLQTNGKCEDAIRWYKVYKEKLEARDGDDAYVGFIEDCDYSMTFTNNPEVQVKNMRSLNTEYLDFSASPYSDGLIFTSTRGSDRIVVNKDSWSNDNFTDLYYAKVDETGQAEKVKTLTGEINGKHHDGVATFNQGKSVMFFTRSSAEGKSKKGLKDLKLYMAYNHESYWSGVKPLAFNSEEFASAHPSLSSDGDRLYFSSDRPGGFGGMDIYVSNFNGSDWSKPLNLGPTVNTAGQELFPFIGQDDVLYFSSNGHVGMGGLDIYRVSKSDESDEESWDVRSNLGMPFNSKKDDFGFYTNSENTEGYLSSDRQGGEGGDDIYSWSVPEPISNSKEEVVNRLICVYDKETQEKVSNASVMLYQKENDSNQHKVIGSEMKNLTQEQQAEVMGHMNKEKSPQSFKTNENGQFLFAAKKGITYSVRVEKNEYELKEFEVEGVDLVNEKEFCIEINKLQCQYLTVLVMNSEYDNPLPGAKVLVQNKCTGEEEEITTRKDGTARTCMDCGCAYELKATKSLFNTNEKVITAQSGNCSTAPGEETVILLKLLEPEVPEESQEVQALRTHFLGDPNGQFYVGQIITLKDIYYNYNKSDIRSDALPRLDKVQQLMKAFPTMEIEMMSHTDSRGRSTYNNSLSMKRAQSARHYVVSRGVVPSRLTSKGYGENQLTNHCRDGVECSEDEHQLNRRTEIKIIKL